VAERDLALADIDLGDVTEAELGGAGAKVFEGDEPGIVGPVDTPLGAALFRVNAILAAQETSFEDARAILSEELALDRARRAIGDMLEGADDLLAGGATLEELADETELRLAQIDWTAGSSDGIAAYEAFRQAAASAARGDFPEIEQLEDGGIFALRVNEITAPHLPDFSDARGQAESGWRAAETARRLAGQAQALADQLAAGVDPEDLGLTMQVETGITRDAFIPETPPTFTKSVFDMAEGDIQVIAGETAAYLVRLNRVAPPDTQDEENAARRDRIAEGVAQSLGNDILRAYSAAIENQAGISLNQAAINAVHAQFP